MIARLNTNLEFFSREWALYKQVCQEARVSSLFDQHSGVHGSMARQTTNTETQEPGSVFAAIDEVGRGSVAGPVFVCATFWRVHQKRKTRAKNQTPRGQFTKGVRGKTRIASPTLESLGICDSKKLSQQVRTQIYDALSEHIVPISAGLCLERNALSKALNPRPPLVHLQANPADLHGDTIPPENTCELMFCSLGASTVEEIESHNIWKATQMALCRSLMRAELHFAGRPAFIVFDGKWASFVPESWESVPFVTLKKADDLLVSAGLSSVVAKVARDGWMAALENTHPAYGFARHKGYGTRQHLQAITKHGLLDVHRRSFLRRLDLTQQI